MNGGYPPIMTPSIFREFGDGADLTVRSLASARQRFLDSGSSLCQGDDYREIEDEVASFVMLTLTSETKLGHW